ADKQHVVVLGMSIDEEVAVRSVLVLTHARLDQRRVLERGKAPRDVATDRAQSFRAHSATAPLGIERRAVIVERDLHAAVLNVRGAVHFVVVVKPTRHMRRRKHLRTRRRAKEEHFLPRGKDAIAEHMWKEFRQPRPAGEDEYAGGDAISVFPCN